MGIFAKVVLSTTTSALQSGSGSVKIGQVVVEILKEEIRLDI